MISETVSQDWHDARCLLRATSTRTSCIRSEKLAAQIYGKRFGPKLV
jgi:hypothetical protein